MPVTTAVACMCYARYRVSQLKGELAVKAVGVITIDNYSLTDPHKFRVSLLNKYRWT